MAFARRQAGCKTLARELYGVGPLVAAIVWAFLGDTRRFSSSAQAVRHSGLDVTVHASDDKRTPGHLPARDRRSCAGPCSKPATTAPAPPPRTTATTPASQPGSTPNRAALSVARKLARRCHHILRRLGDQAYAPVPAGR